MSEVALFFGLSSQRLRGRCRWGGGALALTLLLPYELVDGVPQLVWQLAPELPPAGVVAAFAPTAAGLAIIAASFLARRPSSLAAVVLSAIALAAVFIRLGADAAAWEVLPLPESLTDRPTAAFLALSLTAAGACLAFRPAARRISRAVLGAALASSALFYAWPARGEAPLVSVARALGALPDLPSWRFQLGMILLSVVALWPLAIPLAGLRLAFRPPAREHPVIAALAIYGLPGILMMFAYRALIGAQGGAGLLASVLAILILTGLLALVASAVEVLAEVSVSPEAALEQPPGLALRRAAAIGTAAVVLLGAAQWGLARPPQKGVAWTPGAASPDGDKLFGELLHAWSEARLRWDRRVRADSGAASGLVQVKGAARELAGAARGLDDGLGASIEALTREAEGLDLAGRRWYRLIGDVNEASRRAGLPYYVDPTVRMVQTEDGLRRHFAAHSYRIERVRRFQVGDTDFATLHVRQLGHRRDGHSRLGFSRDLQPFALVVIDELEPFREELAGLAAASRCRPVDAADAADAGDEALQRCGELLAQGATAAGGPAELLAALTAGTERHELQHQIDGPHLPLSSVVLERLGGYAEESQRRVNRELSAYVAEMTAPGSAPRLSLVHLARFALLAQRGAEHHVGVIALAAMSGQDLGRGGAVDRAAAARALAALAKESDDALRARAAEAWADLFGAPLPAATPL